MREVQTELPGRAAAEVIREPRLILRGLLGLQLRIRGGHPRIHFVDDPQASEVVDRRPGDTFVEAGVEFKIPKDIVFGREGRKHIAVLRLAGDARLALKLVAEASQGRRPTTVGAGGIDRVAGRQHLGAEQRVPLTDRIFGILQTGTEAELQLRGGAGIDLGVARLDRLAEEARRSVEVSVVVFRSGRVAELLGMRPEQVGHGVAIHARRHPLHAIHIVDRQRVGRAEVKGVGRDELGADIGPITRGGVFERACRGIGPDRVAEGSGVGPDLDVAVTAVIAVFLVPLAAEFERDGKFPKRHDPLGVQLARPDFGGPNITATVGPGAAVAGRGIGEIAQVIPVGSRGLPDRPFPRLSMGPRGRETARHTAALGARESALQGLVIIQRTRVAGRPIDDPGGELVFKARGKRAGVGELGGGPAAVVERGGVGGGGAVGDDGCESVTPDGITTIVDVGIVVGGDEGEIAVPKFALGVGVDGVQREHEIARRLEIGGQQHGIF